MQLGSKIKIKHGLSSDSIFYKDYIGYIEKVIKDPYGGREYFKIFLKDLSDPEHYLSTYAFIWPEECELMPKFKLRRKT